MKPAAAAATITLPRRSAEDGATDSAFQPSSAAIPPECPWSATGYPKTDPDAQIATALLQGTNILKPDEAADREVGHSVKYITLEDDRYDYTWAASREDKPMSDRLNPPHAVRPELTCPEHYILHECSQLRDEIWTRVHDQRATERYILSCPSTEAIPLTKKSVS